MRMFRQWRATAAFLLVALAPHGRAVGAEIAHGKKELAMALDEFEQAQEAQVGNPDQAGRLFRSAAQRFESILAMGIENGPLHYNLGNCYLQAGRIGEAILHYRRAERFAPRDPLLKDNLREARSRCLTTVATSRKRQFLQSVFFWHHDMSAAERCWVGIACYVLFWLLLTLRNVVPKRGVTVAAVAVMLMGGAMAASLAVDSWRDRRAPSGVVLGMDIVVRKGPGTGYARQFEQPLQPGVEFSQRAARGDWWHITLPDGQAGWITATSAELIRPRTNAPRLGTF